MRLLLALGALAPQDTTQPRTLAPLMVTAERAPSRVGSSAAAVTRLSAAELAQLPHATLADLLRRAPGVAVVDFDGLGFDPQLMIRGFYGGGEAEYVVVQIDGRPVNQLQSGVVAWDVLPPLAAVEAIEVVRGGASSLYGDAAIGGVINVITRHTHTGRPALRAEAGGGRFSSLRGSADLAGAAGSLAAGLDHTGGFRQHSERTAARGIAQLPLAAGPHGRLDATARGHWREYDDPGPLLETLLAQDRAGSDPLFRFDHARDRSGGLGLAGDRALGSLTQLSGALDGELRSMHAIRTLALAPGFGDTQERHAATHRASLGLQLATSGRPVPRSDRLIVGLEAGHGGLDSRYYSFAGGTRDDYVAASGVRGPLASDAHSTRATVAGFVQFIGHPVEPLRIFLGARFDALRDRFEPRVPSGGVPRGTTHHAWSPKAGINLRYAVSDRNPGSLYLSVSRSFKAPTLDQLYDQRAIPVPFPPFAIQTSNPALRPQHGTSYEAGLYQSAALSPRVRAGFSASVYQMDMTDELDFDVSSLHYVNLGRSRHRGLEAGGSLELPRGSAFVSYAWQHPVSRSGSNADKRLKAIPQHALSAGATWRPLDRLSLGLDLTHAADVFLDDANTRSLPAYTRVDAQLEGSLRELRLFLEARNLFDAHYSSTGFLDPAGSGAAYFYPAAGRVIELGLRYGW